MRSNRGLFGFALSKLNLLVFVIAVFSILSFFSFQVGKGLNVQFSRNLVDSKARIASDVLTSPNYCSYVQQFIPGSFSTLGQTEFFYLMNISSKTVPGNPPDSMDSRLLIFSVSDRKDPEHLIAASSFPTQASIQFWHDVPGQTQPKGFYSDSILLDPQAYPPINSYYLVKEVLSGKATLYVVPCSIYKADAGACAGVLKSAGESIHPKVSPNPGGFLCAPKLFGS